MPHTLGAEQTLAHASDVMKKHGIRHLPILHGGRVVGMLSERDIALVETLEGVDPRKVRVDEAMTPSPFIVEPSRPMDEVCAEMAERKYGAAIVVDAGHVVGVLTTVDVCRVVAELWSSRRAP